MPSFLLALAVKNALHCRAFFMVFEGANADAASAASYAMMQWLKVGAQ